MIWELSPPPIPPVQKMVSLENLWTTFVKMRGAITKSTAFQYAHVGKKFCAFFKERKLSHQALHDWVEYLIDLKTISPNKINEMNIRVKAFLRWLHQRGVMPMSLADSVPHLLAPEQRESLMFTEEEYEKIKAYAKGRPWCQVHLWLCILAYRTGMALVDCCYLRWQDIHLDDNGPSYIVIYRHKTKRLGIKAKCHIPIIPATDMHKWLVWLKDNVERYPRADGITDFVHPDAPGLYECVFQKIGQDFRNMFKGAGIGTEKTFRHFRNSFCSNLVNSDVQIALICQMTGHNNVKTLLRYLKPDSRALQDGLSKAFQFAAAKSGVGKMTDPFDPKEGE